MTWKQFQQWCNERACDGCWGHQEAMLCIDVLRMIRQLPFWKRKRVWAEAEDEMLAKVINPINKKIQELRGTADA